MKLPMIFPLLFSVCFIACSNHVPKPEATEDKRIVMRFELDSTGNLTDTAVVRQLEQIALKISSNADRVMLHSYTEKQDSIGKDIVMARVRAEAAKAVMAATGLERMYYNVGIDARGFENPVDAGNPKSLQNRRIEIEFMK